MKTLILLAMFAICQPAYAAKPLTLCVTGTGGIVAKKKCKAGETILTTVNIGAYGLQGPAGPQGPMGEKGEAGPTGPGFDIKNCQLVYGSGVATEFGSVEARCPAAHFLLTHGISAPNADEFVINEIVLLASSNDEGIPGGVRYWLSGEAFTAEVTAFCCPQ